MKLFLRLLVNLSAPVAKWLAQRGVLLVADVSKFEGALRRVEILGASNDKMDNRYDSSRRQFGISRALSFLDLDFPLFLFLL